MTIKLEFIRHQLPVIGAIGKSAVHAVRQKLQKPGAHTPPPLPGPLLEDHHPAPDPKLCTAFVRHLGGDPASYRGVVPPHLFPQWTFPVLMSTLAGVPYPLLELLNGGCKLTVNADIPLGVPLQTKAQLVGIDDDGRRAILHQHVTTGPESAPEALAIDFYPIVRLRSKDGGEGRAKKKDTPTVPYDGVREVGRYALDTRAGLEFAVLTGDFNPVHWVPPAARALGMKNVILHGFAELGRAVEAVVKVLWAGDARRLQSVDVRFVRPLVLPKKVGVYVRGFELWVGDAPGGPAYMTGTFAARAVTGEGA